MITIQAVKSALTLKVKIQITLTILAVVGAGVIGIYLAGGFNPHATHASTPSKDPLFMSCNDLDQQFNYYNQQSIAQASKNPSVSIADNREANTLLSIYNDQGCFQNQTGTAPSPINVTTTTTG